MIPAHWQPESQPITSSNPLGEIHIEDVITFDSGEVLVLLRVSAAVEFPTKDGLECRFGDRSRFAYTAPLALHAPREERAAVFCAPPPPELTWDLSSFLIEVDQAQEIRHLGEGAAPLRWNSSNLVVYESFPKEDEVVVFLHGMNAPRSRNVTPEAERARLSSFKCVFNDVIETTVLSVAQEVLRCEHPPSDMISALSGKKVTVRFKGRLLPSVAYYKPRDPDSQPLTSRKLMANAPHAVCACTMIYNGAKFLNEWVHYHTHLGVSKFFLYDNNSEDNLDETIAELTDRKFNVTKQPWPWVKTQEAGFSHCSLLANPECDWMLYTDVDEYLFPNKNVLSTDSPLATLITDAVTQSHPTPVGQLITFCHNYGPSGLTISPLQGVTQGYTCRMRKPERHKSLVKLDTVATNLSNVIHHFNLRDGYATVKIPPAQAIINHYKFQVWDEFKTKFRRRAATYVADWTENRNHGSNDRVPDLGTRAVKPADWELRYCEVWDYGLRNYTRSVFGKYDSGSLRRLRLAWERNL